MAAPIYTDSDLFDNLRAHNDDSGEYAKLNFHRLGEWIAETIKRGEQAVKTKIVDVKLTGSLSFREDTRSGLSRSLLSVQP